MRHTDLSTLLFEGTPMAVVILIRTFHIRRCNAAGIDPDDKELIVRANAAAVESHSTYNQAVRVYNPLKRSWVWVQTISTPVRDARGVITLYNGIVLDITKEKDADQSPQHAYETLERRVEERMREIEHHP